MDLDGRGGLIVSMRELIAPWGDGEHHFSLRFGELKEIEEATGDTRQTRDNLFQILGRFSAAAVGIEEVQRVIRLGLIGGGTSKDAALKLVARHFDDVPMMDSIRLGLRILSVALTGRDIGGEEEPAEGEAGAAGEAA